MTITIAADTPALQVDYIARLEHRLEINRVYKSDCDGLRLLEVPTDDAERREMLDSDMDGIGARDATIAILDDQVERLQRRVTDLHGVLRRVLHAAEAPESLSDRLDRIRILAAAAIPEQTRHDGTP